MIICLNDCSFGQPVTQFTHNMHYIYVCVFLAEITHAASLSWNMEDMF